MFGEQFLTAPSLFPARIAGETYGADSFVARLPGGPYRITGITSAHRDAVAHRYRETTEPAAFDVIVHRAPASDFRTFDTRGWEYSLDFDAGAEQIAIAGMHLMARIDLPRRRAGIWTSIDDADALWPIVENVLRPLVAVRLLDADGLLVHSAAIALDGRGLLFAGASGAGKSTVAQLAVAASHPVLSDDLNALARDGDGFRIEPLPFSGDLDPHQLSRDAAPLHAIVQLEKADRESLAPLSRAQAAALLVRSAPYVNRDAHRAERLVERAAEVVAASRSAVLAFRRDGDLWPILRGL